jgi:hypothetical protein
MVNGPCLELLNVTNAKVATNAQITEYQRHGYLQFVLSANMAAVRHFHVAIVVMVMSVLLDLHI